MNIDLFNDYYKYKIKVIYEYSILLSKIIGIDKNKLFSKKKSTEEVLKYTINDYFKSNNNNNNLLRMFINDKDISKYKIDKELLSCINYFINNQKGFEIKAYEKEIVLVSSIINIAKTIDISTSPYKENKNNYRTILTNCLEKFNKIPYFNLIDDGKKKTNELLELIKENVKKERKIFDLLNSKVSFNKYISISNDNKYYLSFYNYSIPNIKSVNELATKYVYEKENIDDKLSLISKDLILLTLMKLFSLSKLRKVFFLPVKSVFLNNKDYLNELNNIYKDKILSKYIKVLINNNDYNIDVKNILDDNKIDYYIYCNKNSTDNNLIGNNYLITNEFIDKYDDYINKLKDSNKRIIYEKINEILLDNDLLEGKEN